MGYAAMLAVGGCGRVRFASLDTSAVFDASPDDSQAAGSSDTAANADAADTGARPDSDAPDADRPDAGGLDADGPDADGPDADGPDADARAIDSAPPDALHADVSLEPVLVDLIRVDVAATEVGVVEAGRADATTLDVVRRCLGTCAGAATPRLGRECFTPTNAIDIDVVRAAAIASGTTCGAGRTIVGFELYSDGACARTAAFFCSM